MKKLFHCLFLFFLISCSEDDDVVSSTTLEVNLVSDGMVHMDENLVLQIEVKNADSLFALSLELHYSSNVFEASSPAVASGDLFSDPFKHELLSIGEVGIALGEQGEIKTTSSGIACQIVLAPMGLGTDLLYVSTLHMIKSNGESIDGFNALAIEPIEVNVVE